jgi:hypothetical protein
VFTADGSGYSLDRAAKLAGISEGLLILWIDIGRFTPSLEADDLSVGNHIRGWERFTVTEVDLTRLRKSLEFQLHFYIVREASTSRTPTQRFKP